MRLYFNQRTLRQLLVRLLLRSFLPHLIWEPFSLLSILILLSVSLQAGSASSLSFFWLVVVVNVVNRLKDIAVNTVLNELIAEQGSSTARN